MMLEWALWYLDMGLRPLPACRPTRVESPCEVGGANAANTATQNTRGVECRQHGLCLRPGKVPLVPWRDLTNGKRVDRQQVESWWSRWPDANIALVCGPEIVVLDIEHHGVERPELIELAGTMPTLRSQAGGLHFWLRPDGRLRTSPWITREGARPGEVRSHGSLATAPPSVGRRGPYRWLAGCGPHERVLGAAPAFLLDVTARPLARRGTLHPLCLESPSRMDPRDAVRYLPERVQHAFLHGYSLVDRSRLDARVAIELVKLGADDSTIAGVLQLPSASKAAGKARAFGRRSATDYLVRTIGWARNAADSWQ